MMRREDIFRAIADPELYQQQEADDGIRQELMKIKEHIDQINRLAESLPQAKMIITSKTRDIEDTAIAIADVLDRLQQLLQEEK
jgi:ABC-type transporter Mla subunit MlaD